MRCHDPSWKIQGCRGDFEGRSWLPDMRNMLLEDPRSVRLCQGTKRTSLGLLEVLVKNGLSVCPQFFFFFPSLGFTDCSRLRRRLKVFGPITLRNVGTTLSLLILFAFIKYSNRSVWQAHCSTLSSKGPIFPITPAFLHSSRLSLGSPPWIIIHSRQSRCAVNHPPYYQTYFNSPSSNF